ncbi:RNA polymerase sigma-70 factor [Maribellus comscasis]|uniref:RNA polymerase sigma-70 factor n=1 Tax=Maribellus comscasis TaxID=2681766 RepID=A0A6I6JV84_9BACT|nr:RNA polymerase sigma-70 factor [Maribellus comscasis]QGY45020.1 RNA polymerase sigma-70 factor [Maribellus comscasis]
MSKTTNYPDNFLLAELRNGEERAFDFIFRKYYKALCAQAVAYVSDLDIAQSQVQECFIKLWEKRSNAAKIENIASYLSLMVRNQCIDYLRKSKSIANLHQKTGVENVQNTTGDTVLYHEFEEKLIIALASLPERSREAFEYSRFEGLSYTQIAERMGISVKAVEGLMSRALKVLRVELKDYLPIVIILYKLTHL